MRAADFALQVGGGIGGLSVDGYLRAQAAREVQLGVIDVHRSNIQPHRFRILHGHVAQPADARNHDPVSRARVGHLQALVDGDARAQHGGDVDESHPPFTE
ncbi:hypothetical protein G6F50_015796 [Rhizopus delemar]|uniref:Uncharacterized protein n=1 Tax=Rhizopus delemar TaxID=936053 RepID=A0A9P6XWG2_9FUNG|nr:hypothetical protein G6F50_015796 [Rhizopus delemar]